MARKKSLFRPIEKLLSLIGLPGDIQIVLQLIGLGGLATMTGWAAYSAEKLIYWGVFIGLGAAAFGFHALNQLRILRQRARLHYKLFPTSIHGVVETIDDAEILVTLYLDLRNTSDRELFVILDRSNHSLGNTTSRPENTTPWKSIIPPNSTQTIGLPGIRVPNGSGNYPGELDIIFHYGREEEEYTHTLDFNGGIEIVISKQVKGVIQTVFKHEVRRLDYTRI